MASNKRSRSTVDKYIDLIRSATDRPGKFAYRGQNNSNWNLNSSAERRLRKFSISNFENKKDFSKIYLKYHEDILIEPARHRGFGVENGRRISDIQLLAKLQHLGAATGLIDFTWNPLVALWFAADCSEFDGKLFMVNTEDPTVVEKLIDKVPPKELENIFTSVEISPRLMYWEPEFSGESILRIIRQSSLFIIDRPSLSDVIPGVAEITIEKNDKKLLIQELETLDISRKTMFLDVYGLAATESVDVPLPVRWQINPDDTLRKGNEFLRRKEYLNAIDQYTNLIEFSENFGEQFLMRGIAYAENKNYRKAIADYDQAIELKNRPNKNLTANSTIIIHHPYLYIAYFNRGNCKAELNENEEAIEDYDRAIQAYEFGQKPACLYFNRANVKAKLDRFEESINDYDEAIYLGEYRAYFNKGNILTILGKFDEAMNCYENFEEKVSKDQGEISNRFQIEKLINRVNGNKFKHKKLGDFPTLQLRVRILNATKKETLDFIGNFGNTGNFGLRSGGGKGFPGEKGFTVIVEGVENQ